MKYLLGILLAFLSQHSAASLAVLMYHNISSSHQVTSVSEESFREQMEYLAKSDIVALSGKELNELLLLGYDFSDKRYVAITFDDGWRTQRKAIEILKENKIPAIFFVNGEPISEGLRVYLTEADVRNIAKDSLFMVADHSFSHDEHILLSKHINEDYVKNQKFLKEVVGVEEKTYAYPYGKKTKDYKDFLISKGVKVVYGVNEKKINDSSKINIYDVPRISIQDTTKFLQIMKYISVK